ncbi:MAG: hypothetical protein IPK31_07665 [Chitinophagaceae bacterium]|nr:hypothetical protein [Chitinophagaceae bacterium]
MTEEQFYQLLHRRLSQIAIGASAIRNQGSGGLIKILREYFEKEVNLEHFIKSLVDETQYRGFLDGHTSHILSLFPDTAQSWGAARKGLNLFLREVVYSKFFSTRFSLPGNFDDFNLLVKFMEVPLDKEVAHGLIIDSIGHLPKWINIKHLTPALSEIYQSQAFIIAKQENVARVNLDLKYWRSV